MTRRAAPQLRTACRVDPPGRHARRSRSTRPEGAGGCTSAGRRARRRRAHAGDPGCSGQLGPGALAPGAPPLPSAVADRPAARVARRLRRLPAHRDQPAHAGGRRDRRHRRADRRVGARRHRLPAARGQPGAAAADFGCASRGEPARDRRGRRHRPGALRRAGHDRPCRRLHPRQCRRGRRLGARGEMRSLRVVTAGYHMPRAMLEMRRALPGMQLVAHPVPSSALRARGALRRPQLWALLAGEYARYLGAWAGLSGAFVPRREPQAT